MTTPSTLAGDHRAWGWVAHLRTGGTTPWAAWSGSGAAAGADLPGAQHLELLRRLNEIGSPSRELVDRVLAADLPGRGRADLDLVGAAGPSGFGPPPVDPASIPAGELLRVATGLLAQDLVARGPVPLPRPPRHLFFRTSYRLTGDAELVTACRDRLVAQGRPPGGRRPRVLVLATSLDRMLADAWARRSFGSGALPWSEWLTRLERDDHLPGGIDVLGQVRRAVGWAGAGRVHVVLDPGHLGDLTGATGPVRLPAPLASPAPELARRVSTVLGLHVTAPERAALLRHRLRPLVADAPGPALTVPVEHRDWTHRQAIRLQRGLRGTGVAVHGDPDTLLPSGEGVSTPDLTATVLLAMRLLLRPAGAPGSTEEGV